jgi:hypothetical protein
LGIFDLSDPDLPVRIGNCDLAGYANGLAKEGNYVYVAVGISGVRVIDVTSPTNPVEVGYYLTTPNEAIGVTVSGKCAFLTGGERLTKIDVRDKTNPHAVVPSLGAW